MQHEKAETTMATMVKRIVIAAGSILLLQAETKILFFRPGPENSLELRVDKTGLLRGKQHRFVFREYEGRLEFDEQTPAASNVSFTVQSNSIMCEDTWVSASDLQKIMKTAKSEMLAVERYPVVTFRSTKVDAGANGQFLVAGLLTIREQTRPVSLTVGRTDSGAFRGEAKVKMTDLGLKPPSAALGLVGTKDEMQFSFTLTPAAGNKSVAD